MNKVTIHKANIDMFCHKNATFTRGKYYLGRMSKRNDMYVVKSNEGYWTSLIRYHYTVSKKELFELYFTNENHFYVNNRKSLNRR